MLKNKHEIRQLKKIKCGKEIKGRQLAKSSFKTPIIWKSRRLHKRGYLKGQYKSKEK